MKSLSQIISNQISPFLQAPATSNKIQPEKKLTAWQNPIGK
jgi:hypothetical protein